MHPGNGIDMQAGLALAAWRVVIAPGAQRQSARMVASAEDEDVTLAEPHALALFDFLELRTGDGLARLEPFDLAEVGGIQHHAAADDALVVSSDAAPFGAARGQECRRL